MAESEKAPVNFPGTNAPGPSDTSAIDRLRDKAEKLKTPRGKYRCRKCHDLPCTCVDPKQATSAAPVSAPPGPAVLLFTEKASKRLLEAAFGIPTVLTQCRLWALTEEEALELCKPTADVLNEFVTVDPKWVAVTILSVSLGSIVAKKSVLYSAWKRAMMLEAGAQRAQTPPAPEPPPAPAGPPPPQETRPGPAATMEMLQ